MVLSQIIYKSKLKLQNIYHGDCHTGLALRPQTDHGNTGLSGKENRNDNPCTQLWVVWRAGPHDCKWGSYNFPFCKNLPWEWGHSEWSTDSKRHQLPRQLTPPDNLITLTLELTCGPSPPPLFARCMTVLFAPGLASGGRPCRDATRAVCEGGGGPSPSAGFTCRTLCWAGLWGTVLACLKCFNGFICCPWYCMLAPDGTKFDVLGWTFETVTSWFFTRSLFFTFCLTCAPGKGNSGFPLVGNGEAACCSCSAAVGGRWSCCCWASLSSSSFFLAPACCCRRSSFCLRISSRRRFCSSIFKRYNLVSSSSSGNCKRKWACFTTEPKTMVAIPGQHKTLRK